VWFIPEAIGNIQAAITYRRPANHTGETWVADIAGGTIADILAVGYTGELVAITRLED
jgi:hypothetical protein